tara:strand:+ start:266 stop:478 length:213 start_codon:yes stop_codon:yes gene_type:complete
MNGWRNRETWLINLWFEYVDQEELDSIKQMIDEELDDLHGKLPGYMIDLLGVNFLMNEIDWDDLGGRMEA